ncbi:MAG: porin family protein [Calothrix sp. SM1_5_4]|nr:porin family protein [Calothrix sp. SM1_5_4]
MRFSKIVALIAIAGVAGQAFAANDGGGLRRASRQQEQVVVAQAQQAQAQTQVEAQSLPAAQGVQGVVIVNTADSPVLSEPVVQVQPATVVEATPAAESKAEVMRKARQGAELQTEQKIVEKLEESRLREEQERAERLFGNKIEPKGGEHDSGCDGSRGHHAPGIREERGSSGRDRKDRDRSARGSGGAEKAVEQPKVEPVAAPVAAQPELQSPQQQLMPATLRADVAEDEAVVETGKQFYIGGLLAAPNYNASNVETNFGLGFTIGKLVNPNVAVEGGFLYSNYNIDTYWQPGLYRELDQYDVSIGAKYFFMTGRIKPFLGGSATYVYREYNERIRNSAAWYLYNAYTTSEETHAVNLGLVGGVDFDVAENFVLGLGLDYNFNVMSKNDIDYGSYGLPVGERSPLEKIDYTTVKVNARILF